MVSRVLKKNPPIFWFLKSCECFQNFSNFFEFPLKRNFPKVFVAKVQKFTQKRNIDSIAFPATALKWPFNIFWTKNRSQIVWISCLANQWWKGYGPTKFITSSSLSSSPQGTSSACTTQCNFSSKCCNGTCVNNTVTDPKNCWRCGALCWCPLH